MLFCADIERHGFVVAKAIGLKDFNLKTDYVNIGYQEHFLIGTYSLWHLLILEQLHRSLKVLVTFLLQMLNSMAKISDMAHLV